MYMLESMGDRTPPCGTPFLNWRCIDVLFLKVVYATFDVVCDVFDNGAWDVVCVECFAHV